LTNTQRRKFLQLAAGALAFAALPACRNEGSRPIAEGDRFPPITLPDLDGRSTSIPPGPALIVNFWATWCEPCRREMPSLQRLSTQYRSEDLQVVGISVDDDLNLVKEFQLRYRLTFPLLSDREQHFSRMQLQVAALPMTYLLRRDRVVAGVVAGARDWADAGVIREIEGALELKAHKNA
jgi:peroxiredoxin